MTDDTTDTDDREKQAIRNPEDVERVRKVLNSDEEEDEDEDEDEDEEDDSEPE